MSINELMLMNDLREQGWNVLHKGWPDYIVWKDDPFTVVFLEQKVRNNALKPEQYMVLKLLVRLGLQVKINCGGGLEDSLSLEEYMTGGASKFFQISNPQMILNYRHDIRVMRETLSKMAENDPKRRELVDRMIRREEMLPPEKRILTELEHREQATNSWLPKVLNEKAAEAAGKAKCVCGKLYSEHDKEPPHGIFDTCYMFRYPDVKDEGEGPKLKLEGQEIRELREETES